MAVYKRGGNIGGTNSTDSSALCPCSSTRDKGVDYLEHYVLKHRRVTFAKYAVNHVLNSISEARATDNERPALWSVAAVEPYGRRVTVGFYFRARDAVPVPRGDLVALEINAPLPAKGSM